MVLTEDCTKLEEAEKTVLIFHRYGDQYFLEQVWIEGNTIGRQFVKSKIETQLLGKNHQDREEVNVAANVAAQRTRLSLSSAFGCLGLHSARASCREHALEQHRNCPGATSLHS